MLVGIWPSTYLIHRLPAGKYLSGCSMCWSIMTLCIAACHNWAGLMVLRFLMGFFEAIINPGATLLISVFWKKSEQPIRNGSEFFVSRPLARHLEFSNARGIAQSS